MDNTFRKPSEYKDDIARLSFERNMMLNGGLHDHTDHADHAEDMGEITGQKYDNDLEKGMPIRSQYNIRKPIHDENKHIDFNIHHVKAKKINVKSYDDGGDAGYAEIDKSMNDLSSQLNPITSCKISMEKMTNNIFYNIFKSMNSHYLVNGLGLYNLFGCLYILSNDITEVELKKFFDFPQKDELFKGFVVLNELDDIFRTTNFMIIGDEVPINIDIINKLKMFCDVLICSDKKHELSKINNHINKIMGAKMKNIITQEILFNLQLTFLTVLIIHPVWLNSFDEIVGGYFNKDDTKTEMNFLFSENKTFGYYEDKTHQLLEIVCANKTMTMGVLIGDLECDEEKLHYFIKNIKNSLMDEVYIPVINSDVKMRFTNVLKNMGLKTPFVKVSASKLFPENVVLQDVIQNVKIIIDNNYVNKKHDNKKAYRSNRKFIANRKFIYYFRMIKTNTFVCIGTFDS
jgi:hypothetical protein